MNTSHKLSQKSSRQIEKIIGEKLTLGRLIWAIRMADETSQVEFAKILEISPQHLCDIEHNRKTISPALAEKYAEKLQHSKHQFIRLSLQDLVDREGLSVSVDVKPLKHRKSGRTDNFAYA